MKKAYIYGALALLFFIGFTVKNSYKDLVNYDEDITKAWSEVLNQYQRRADLVPNLVEVVKGFASHEAETLKGVVEARAKATSFQITPEVLSNPQAFQKFQEAQGSLSQALSRLMVIQENYPKLKADIHFQQLQMQLEGTENRITYARKGYIDMVATYNKVVRNPPFGMLAAWIGDFKRKENFSVADEKAISTAPKLKF